MDTIDELLWVLIITVLGGCFGFFMFLYNHGKERKKEIRKARDNKNSAGQHDKPVHDESSSPSTAPTQATASTSSV